MRMTREIAWIKSLGLAAGLAVWVAMASPASAVTLAKVFGPNMVLQQAASVPVWGMAKPGEKVTVTFGGQSKSASADARGRWMVRLDAMDASRQGRPLVVTGADKPVTIENVLVGEVWLLLHHGVDRQYKCEGPVPEADARFCQMGGGYALTPQTSYGKGEDWLGGRRRNPDLMSIALADGLIDALHVPVGIVSVEIGDLDATIPCAGYRAIPSLTAIADKVDAWYPTTKAGKAAYEKWFASLKQWRKDIGEKMARGEPIRPSQPPLVPGPVPGDRTQPTVAFNSAIHPLVPFAFRGVFHCHESTVGDDPAAAEDPRYPDKMHGLIAGLRAVFNRPGLAFAYTQREQPGMYHAHTLGGKEKRDDLDANAWMGFRDRQRRVLPYDNTGMVVTAEIENYPSAVAKRFVGWALAAVYDKGGSSSGPIYKSHRVEGDRVIVAFSHADGGLMMAGYPEIGRPLVEQKGAKVRFFAVAGADHVFHTADARIEGDTVVVHCDKVAKPQAVRYACHFDPRGMNLYSRAGLPASPFRTDDWPIEPVDRLVEKIGAESPDALAAMMGYPTMPLSHAAARALAAKGEAVALPIVKRMLADKDRDLRCGGLRTLGYLHWLGPIPGGSKYYGLEPQAVTPSLAKALAMISAAVDDPDPLVRRTVAEATALIGAENEAVFGAIRKLAVDDDILVRSAAMRVCKFRFNSYEHNTTLAYAVLTQKPFGDRISLALAGTTLNHYRIKGPIDIHAAASYLAKIGPGQGGPIVSDLGDMLRRVKSSDGAKALDDPQVMQAVLHLYSIGYRNYFLYGIWHWVTFANHVPAIEAEIVRLKGEIDRLRRDKPAGWQDLSARYADAIVGLGDDMAKYNKKPRNTPGKKGKK